MNIALVDNDAAVNALLNYCAHLTAREQIDLRMQVRLPETLPVTDVDLCSMLGNILSNAVTACQKAEDKYVRITVLAEDASQLCIVAVNSFHGTVRLLPMTRDRCKSFILQQSLFALCKYAQAEHLDKQEFEIPEITGIRR